MKDSYPNLSTTDIQDWVGSASFSKGQSYFLQNAIIEPRRQGMTLKAQCRGSSAPSYRVEVTMGANDIARANCSCPVGGGGHCKHVAALLLTWLEKPKEFQDIENLDSTLEHRSKDELIALILQMLQHHPELEYLLELPSVASGAAKKTIDPEVIRRQVKQAFSSISLDWGWRDPSEIAANLEGLMQLADQYQENDDYSNSAIILRIVSGEILRHEDVVVQDDEGILGWLVNDCVRGLTGCLEDIEESSERREILESLFNVYLADLKMGGLGYGDEVPGILFDLATPSEEDLLAEWVRSALIDMDGWSREELGGFLLDLQGEKLQPEEYLEICRQTGRLKDLVDQLLKLGRVEEAIGETQKANDYILLALAHSFVRNGRGSMAQQLIWDRTKTSRDARLWEWLRDYAFKQGNHPEALELATKLFWDKPSLSDYLEMKKIATQLDNWQGHRSETLSKLVEKNQFELLVEIFLDEGEIGQALEALEQLRKCKRYWSTYQDSIGMRTAKAAEKSYPEQLIHLYLEQVERLIAHRGRKNYKEATTYLKTVCRLYEQIGDQGEWKNLTTVLRQEYHTLPAFQDELNKAGL
jgi:hypothetical protein